MRIHFISIGGSVMHQLAIALKRKGYDVSGSDDDIFEPARTNLEQNGLLPSQTGWFPSNIKPDIDAIILGMHAREDNPELIRARELNLNIYSFPEYIYQESLQKTRVAIGGSHGKTTTTSMIMHVLQEANVNFDYLVGAKLAGFEQSVRITDAPIIVCEADEYPASAIKRQPKFHFLYPHIAVLTGIAWDHINVFPTFANYLEQFQIFINKIESGGVLIFNKADSELNQLIVQNKRSDIRYIPYTVPSHTIRNGRTEATFGEETVLLSVFGEHNLLNLQAAYLVCKELNLNDVTFAQAIRNFKGAAKRLEIAFRNEETIVYRDFAHAPSKVKASINAVKEQFPERKLTAILELHTYSSLNEEFLPQYTGAMEKADVAIVFYSEHALAVKRMKAPEEEKIRQGFQKEGLKVIHAREQLENALANSSLHSHNFLFMSSGTFEGFSIEKWIEAQLNEHNKT